MEIDPTLLAILTSAASAALGALAVDIYVHFKDRTKKALNKRKKERQEELQEAIAPCIDAAVKPINEKIARMEKDVQEIKNDDLPILKDANRDSLRNQLFAAYKHCSKIGYRTMDDTENFDHMFESYKKLNGNGMMIDIHKHFMGLPIKTVEAEKRKMQVEGKTKDKAE